MLNMLSIKVQCAYCRNFWSSMSLEFSRFIKTNGTFCTYICYSEEYSSALYNLCRFYTTRLITTSTYFLVVRRQEIIIEHNSAMLIASLFWRWFELVLEWFNIKSIYVLSMIFVGFAKCCEINCELITHSRSDFMLEISYVRKITIVAKLNILWL